MGGNLHSPLGELVPYYDIINSSQVLFIEKPPAMPLTEVLSSAHL